MKILLVAATTHEIKPYLKDEQIDILICGVGAPFTIYHLTKKLLETKYDMVIQAGIAGTFSNKIKIGEVVLVEQDTFADIGVEENKKFKSSFKLGFDDENKFPFSNGMLRNTNEMMEKLHLKKVTGITINKITDDKKQIKKLKNTFNAEVESMEGAAFHYVCISEKATFIQLRSISNRVGERDKKKWKMKEAIENLNKQVEIIITYLNKNN